MCIVSKSDPATAHERTNKPLKGARSPMAELHDLTDQREFINVGRAVGFDDFDPGWTSVTAETLGESLDELGDEDGEFADNASKLFSGPMTLVEEGELSAPQSEDGKEPGLFPVLVEDSGSLKAIKLPRICASEDGNSVVLVVGDYVGTCTIKGKSISVGSLKGDMESEYIGNIASYG